MNLEKKYTLNDGIKIPILGFGSYQLSDNKKTSDIIEYAINISYRHIDTVAEYDNEKSVGLGIKNAIDDKVISGENIFVSTQLFNDDHGYNGIKIGVYSMVLFHYPKRRHSVELKKLLIF